MSLEFKTATKRKDPITFTLDDDTYEFTPQKSAGVILSIMEDSDEAAALKAMFDWLSDGLSEEDDKKLIARLKDPEDEFDWPDMQEIIQELQKELSGRPTT